MVNFTPTSAGHFALAVIAAGGINIMSSHSFVAVKSESCVDDVVYVHTARAALFIIRRGNQTLVDVASFFCSNGNSTWITSVPQRSLAWRVATR